MTAFGCQHKRERIAGERPKRATWLHKADQPLPPDHEWLLEIADRAKPAVRLAFLEALRKVRNAVQEGELRDAVARGDVNAALRVLGIDKAMQTALHTDMALPLEDAFIDAGRATPPTTLGASIGMRFDLTNPNTATFLRTYNFNLIRQLTDDTREGIRRVITDAFANGGHPYVQAALIRDSIGLTDNQAAAVDNFRALLVSRDRDALTRALRDRRHDRTLDQALGEARTKDLTPEQIDTMVGRYRNRSIVSRAETIARTETMRASNAAQNMAWEQAADAGLLDRATLRRFWMVTPDDRLCPFCEAIPELNENGVPLGGFFHTEQGPVPYPPLHPNCRCITFISVKGLIGA